MEATQRKPGASETEKNILLSKAIECTRQALDADEAGQNEQALELYQRCLEMLMHLMKSKCSCDAFAPVCMVRVEVLRVHVTAETSEPRKDMFKLKVMEILDRAETLKARMQQPQQQQPALSKATIEQIIRGTDAFAWTDVCMRLSFLS